MSIETMSWSADPTQVHPGLLGRGARVLVVEDDTELELPIRRAFYELDPSIEVEWFMEGTQVYWEVCRRRYDLVVADVRLPGGTSGLRLWKLCRIFLPRLPFVLMSASRVDHWVDLSGDACPPFLSKPFSLDVFKECVHGVLTDSQRPPGWRRVQ
jgi:DNA-binding NtrC family response regulator